MQGFTTGAIFYLVSAAGAGGCNEHFWRLLSHRWEQYELTNLHGKVVVLLLIAKRAGHATTARWDKLCSVLFG